MYAINEVNFDLPAFLLSAFCLVYCITVKRRQYVPPKTVKAKLANQHFVFIILLITNLVSSGTSVLGLLLERAPYRFYIWQYLTYAFYFIFHSTLSVCFALYTMNVTGTGANRSKTAVAFFTLPYAVSEALVFINVFNSWTFYIDRDMKYHRGPLMYLLYAFGLFYVVMGFVVFFRYKKAISRADSIAVGLFIGICTLGIVTQAVFPDILVELFFEAIGCLVLMTVLEEKGGRMDITTGLLNRIAFAEQNRRLMGSDQKYGIVLIRMIGLEQINKRFGERETDAFLMNAADFITKLTSENDVFCCRRESFAVIFKGKDPKEADDFAAAVIERFGHPWEIDSVQVSADAAVTVLRVPEQIGDIDDLENLISYVPSKTRTGSYLVPVEAVRRITRSGVYEKALKEAIAENKLRLYYQPIWSVSEGRTVSAEALLRVESEELAGISPEEYVPVAEKTGLIKEIGRFVFEETCRFLSDKRIKNSGIKYTELNLSVYQFMYGDLIESFERIREKYGVEPGRINLEITETAAAMEGDEISEKLKRFCGLGYTLSLDDFGTGYSNLVRMMKSSYGNIKIDKSILWGVTREGSDKKLLQSVMHFIKDQGFSVIQEGVETEEELELVKEYGCDYVQGYYFSKPVPQEEFIEYLEKESVWEEKSCLNG